MKKQEIIKLKPSLRAKIHSLKGKKGKLVAVDPKSGKWFFGDTVLQAIENGQAVFPERIFYILRVGFKTAGMMKIVK